MPQASAAPEFTVVIPLAARVAAAVSADELASLAPSIAATLRPMFEADVGAGWFSRQLSALNDLVTVHAIRLIRPHYRLPQTEWCWLAFGSAARMEQTLVTDQDNGIIFSASGEAEAESLRNLFLPFARDVNELLARCGFPLCDGGIMAGRPQCCLALDEWRQRFSHWIRTPEPDALLNATIFFDFREIHGNANLGSRLRDHLLRMGRDNHGFLRMMGDNALAVPPPLGVLRDFAYEDDGHTVDLKKFGTRLFVDGARLFALANGIPAVTTADRLREIARLGKLTSREAKAAVDALHHLQKLRLRAQYAVLGESSGSVAGEGNCIDPDLLSDFDRRILLESFHQARRLQLSVRNGFCRES